MSAHPDEQLARGGKHLHAVLHTVGDPDVTIAVNGDSFGPREVAGTVTCLAKGPNEIAVSIEDLDAIVEGVGDIQISVFVDGHITGLGQVARRG